MTKDLERIADQLQVMRDRKNDGGKHGVPRQEQSYVWGYEDAMTYAIDLIRMTAQVREDVAK